MAPDKLIALLQRVTEATVSVNGDAIAEIGAGVLILAAVERGDGKPQVQRLAERILAYRVFPDAAGKMNRSVRDVAGGVLLVPQFTLAADTDTGNRPSFGSAADPAPARKLFEALVAAVADKHTNVAAGRFGAEMEIALVNQGPVTFWLRVKPQQSH